MVSRASHGQCYLPGATAKGTSIAEFLTDDAHLGTLTEPPATVFHEGTGVAMNTLRMMLCVRFPLLLCNVEDLLHARGIGAVGLQDTGRWKKNRAEKSHFPVRRRERAMQRFQRMPSLQISSSSTPLASILSTRSAACTQGQISGRTASLLLPSGVSSARQKVQTHCPFGDKSESVW